MQCYIFVIRRFTVKIGKITPVSHPNAGRGLIETREEAKIFTGLYPLCSVVGAPYLSHRPPASSRNFTFREPTRGVKPAADERQAHENAGSNGPKARTKQRPEKLFSFCSRRTRTKTINDPSAGSPTETLLRLLLPLNAQVWESSQLTQGANPERADPNTSLKRSIGSSDGRCVQRAGT